MIGINKQGNGGHKRRGTIIGGRQDAASFFTHTVRPALPPLLAWPAGGAEGRGVRKGLGEGERGRGVGEGRKGR